MAEIVSFDAIARQIEARVAFIRRAVSAQCCYVAANDHILGYAVLEYTFFDMGFISMLYVHPSARRSGVGSALMAHLERLCRTEKLFTSTNLSNQPMQSLLARRGYRLSGVIHDLDEGDPELIYVLRR